MELRHLRYFVAVAEELNFRRAAERLHVSRPALSKQIRELEEEMAVRLLERNTVRVTLTDAGSVFLQDARAVIAGVERAVQRATDAHSGQREKIKIGSVGPIASEFLPRALKQFRQRCHDAEIAFVEVPPQDQADAVARGKLDIAFAYGSTPDEFPDLHHLCVVQSSFGVAISAHHPLARESSLTLDDLTGLPLLVVGGNRRSSHRDNLLRIWAGERIAPPKPIHLESFDAFLNLIAADQGISILPKVLDLRPHGITTVPLKTYREDPCFRMWVLWDGRSPSRAVALFVAILKGMFPMENRDELQP
jgi:DNA-binding transcriptional LysR family regulator